MYAGCSPLHCHALAAPSSFPLATPPPRWRDALQDRDGARHRVGHGEVSSQSEADLQRRRSSCRTRPPGPIVLQRLLDLMCSLT
ncbi:hypothetical protein BRADI_2g38275v3 [Brachypodium distachyon]|uniref:Uncharacterized protein n=1 Tax=Brachypodium distachyon TaxID=15368 RepID=A0A0Q3G973_BRADI|nr:hypothetical protein BRADI_2g38275v3 [Brachypodium distachyon]